MLRKIILSAIIALTLLPLIGIGTAKAQITDLPIQDLWRQYCESRKGDVINLQTWYSGKCTSNPLDPQSIGFSDIVILDFYTTIVGEPTTGSTSQNSGGMFSMLANATSKFFEYRPASTSEYLAHIQNNLNKHSIVQPVYAQGAGFGFQSLSPLLPLWRTFRNITYVIFTLVFVAYGFMIMFRIKLGPQTIVTIQTAIPKIILTLVLITFSYAIVGLLVDIMYVALGIIYSVLFQSNLISEYIRDAWGSGNISLAEVFVRIFAHFFGGLSNKVFTAVLGLPPALRTMVDLLSGAITNTVIIGTGGIALLLFAIVLALFIIYIFIKILFLLLDASIKIILDTIFAPFILLQGILPGSKAFGEWVKDIAANLAIFPAIIMMLTFALIFMGDYQIIGLNLEATPGSGVPFFNDFISPINNADYRSFSLPILGGSRDAEAIFGLIGLGFFWLTPKVADELRKALKVSPPALLSPLGEALGGAARTAGVSVAKGQFQEFMKARGGKTTP